MSEQVLHDHPQVRHIAQGHIHCEGSWTIPYLAALDRALLVFEWPEVPELVWDLSKLSAMDTGGAVVIHRALAKLRDGGRRVSIQGLQPHHEELLHMVASNWSRTHPPEVPEAPILNKVASSA